MVRRNFLKGLSLLGAVPYTGTQQSVEQRVGVNDDPRKYWVEMLSRIVSPVLEAQAAGKLHDLMPVEAVHGESDKRKKVTHLEALGRTLAGLAPWLELSEQNPAEDALKEKFRRLARAAIENAVTPTSKGYMNFKEGAQPLVDAAFLAHALLRAPRQLWQNLDASTQAHLIQALRSTRAIKPYYSNWLLFTAMVEAALLRFSNDYDPVRVDYAVREHMLWYKGDGVYGDGPDFHFDYYNSFVIQPMLLDVVAGVAANSLEMQELARLVTRRAQRYADIQERMISPEGTFPPIGRSLAYRCGAFQLLAQMALQKKLPAHIQPAQVRGGLTAVIKTTMDAPGTFDKNGWLTIGLCGHQPNIGEHYISTGSLYLCTVAFLPLGLPRVDEFWSAPPEDWTSRRAFGGRDFGIDKAL
ncbi:MAG TPA: DUF2264 domain-containing protein [Chryseosolibacter sp.]|nr:DUF2264 domain-containing protein [Chryseosolibacter sp.]